MHRRHETGYAGRSWLAGAPAVAGAAWVMPGTPTSRGGAAQLGLNGVAPIAPAVLSMGPAGVAATEGDSGDAAVSSREVEGPGGEPPVGARCASPRATAEPHRQATRSRGFAAK